MRRLCASSLAIVAIAISALLATFRDPRVGVAFAFPLPHLSPRPPRRRIERRAATAGPLAAPPSSRALGPRLPSRTAASIASCSSSPSAPATALRGRTPNDDLWNSRLKELVAYRDAHGTADVKRTGPNPTLGNWAARQRRDHAAWVRGERSAMTEERRDALEAVGFSFSTRTADERWEGRLEELAEYASKNGGKMDVPESAADCRELATWVKNQRTEYWKREAGRTSSLTDERVRRLEGLGFCWDVRDAVWRRRFGELVEYRDANGHCNVPMSHGSLGDWVLKVRTNYNRLKRGEDPDQISLLTNERIEALRDAGFDFDPLETQFNAMLGELKEFRERTGHIEVGSREGRLSNWYYRQRAGYKKRLKGERSSLTDERTKKLEEAGFHPSMFYVKLNPGSERTRTQWEERLEELKQYKKEHGDCNVSWNQGALGRWVKEQRASCTNKTRIDLLDEVGFIWDVRDWQWWRKYDDLRCYCEENGHANVPHSAGELGEWVTQQRKQHGLRERGTGGAKHNRLTDARKLALDELGFVWDRGEEIRAGQEARWDEKFDLLAEYRERNGDCRVPRSSGALYDWARVQRVQYRALERGEKSKMSERRRKKLKSIGFE